MSGSRGPRLGALLLRGLLLGLALYLLLLLAELYL